MGRDKGAPSLWLPLKGFADRGWKVLYLTAGLASQKSECEKLHQNIDIVRLKMEPLTWVTRKALRPSMAKFAVRALWWAGFQIAVFYQAQKIHHTSKVDIICANGHHAVPVAKVLSVWWRVPLVSKFRGITVTPLLDKRLGGIKSWQLLLALKIPADLLIMTNDGTSGDRLLSTLGANMNKVRFWMNGVNRDLFRPRRSNGNAKRKMGLRHDSKVILMVNRLVEVKGTHFLTEALPQVVKQVPRVVFLVAGEGPARGRLEQLGQRLRVDDHVMFLGALAREELAECFAAADLFVSLNQLANVVNPIFEAMACGKCVMALNSGTTSDVIRDGQNGLLVNREDLRHLPQVIINLLKDERLREQLGSNARKFAEESLLSWEERVTMEVDAVTGLAYRRRAGIKRRWATANETMHRGAI